jgi:hypothetical protein
MSRMRGDIDQEFEICLFVAESDQQYSPASIAGLIEKTPPSL